MATAKLVYPIFVLILLRKKKNKYGRIDLRREADNNQKYDVPEYNMIGVTYSVDFWLLGIAIFKMLTNIFPFQSNGDVFRDFVPEFDDENISNEARKIVCNLLAKDPTERLGAKIHDKAIKEDPFLKKYFFESLENLSIEHDASNHEKNIKDDPFFREIDFVKLEKMEIMAPYFPLVVR